MTEQPDTGGIRITTPSGWDLKKGVELTRVYLQPSITLKGHWMADFSFDTVQKIEVIPEPKQLIIQLAGEE